MKLSTHLPLEKVSFIESTDYEYVSKDTMFSFYAAPEAEPAFELLDQTVKKAKRPAPVIPDKDFGMPDMFELQFLESERITAVSQQSVKTRDYAPA